MPGGIRVTLRRRGDASSVQLACSRPVHAVRVLRSLPATQALDWLPRLFGVCARAHQAAAGAAMGLAPATAADALRAENLREHLLRVHLDWPGLLGLAPDAALLPRLLRACERVRDDPDALQQLLRLHTFGVGARQWLDIGDTAALLAWARNRGDASPAAAMVRHVAGAPRLLDHDAVAWLGQPDLAALRDVLDSPRGDAFVARPEWHGAPRQTGVAGDHADTPLLRDLHARGHALLARFAARLRALAQAALGAAPALRRGDGIAQVETSRGSLLHRVGTDADGRIAQWRVVAPTEWNFHPRGIAAALLRAIPADVDTPRREHLARLVVHAVDPCVAFELDVDREA